MALWSALVSPVVCDDVEGLPSMLKSNDPPLQNETPLGLDLVSFHSMDIEMAPLPVTVPLSVHTPLATDAAHPTPLPYPPLPSTSSSSPRWSHCCHSRTEQRMPSTHTTTPQRATSTSDLCEPQSASSWVGRSTP